MLELVKPTVALRAPWLQAREDWGPGVHEDGFGLRSEDDVDSAAGFETWVARLLAEGDEATPLSDELVHCSHWWIVADGRVLGAIALRHHLNDVLLRVAGHIGYGVRPSARGQGLATWALGRVLPEAARRGMDRVLLICRTDNTASRRAIEHHGGVVEDVHETALGPVCRYWIDVSSLSA